MFSTFEVSAPERSNERAMERSRKRQCESAGRITLAPPSEASTTDLMSPVKSAQGLV